VLCASFALALAGCDRGATAESPGRSSTLPQSRDGQAPSAEAPSELEREGLIIGEYRLSTEPVIDGDTIRVEGIKGSLRLLSIDTEERFHGKSDRVAAAEDFEAYLRRKRGQATRPRKTGTPMGEEASEFAKSFFEGAEVVRLERDDPKKLRGNFGRVLAYAFVSKNGKWTSYNVECVRAGMSPYFTKYGYSHRFHNQLSHAEAEAREAQRGIWSPEAKGYGDYDERKAWWDARADFIRTFEHEASGRDDYIDLTRWDAEQTLEEHLEREVTVLSTVDRIRRFKKLVRVTLTMKKGKTFPIIFFDEEAFEQSNVSAYAKEPIRVRGVVSRYEKGSYRTLQIVADSASQVTLPKLPASD